MSRLHLNFCVLLIGAALACVFVWPAIPEIPQGLEWLRREHYRAQMLERRGQAQNERREAAEHIARGLIEGRLTLSAAVGRYCDLYPPDAHFWEGLGGMKLGSSDEERLGRFLIRWTADVLHEEPERVAPVVARLEAELRACLAAGTIYLPPAVPTRAGWWGN